MGDRDWQDARGRSPMAKIDFKKDLDSLPARGRVPHPRRPAVRYLMIDGHGDPNTAPGT